MKRDSQAFKAAMLDQFKDDGDVRDILDMFALGQVSEAGLAERLAALRDQMETRVLYHGEDIIGQLDDPMHWHNDGSWGVGA